MTIDQLQRLLADAPDLPALWVQLAAALESADRSDEAAEAWRMADLLVPNSPAIQTAINKLGLPGPSPVESPDVEPAPAAPASDPFDLDALIDDLQSGVARPQEDVGSSTPAATNPPQTDDDLATETLARIFESQGHLTEASRVYETLAERASDPNEAAALRAEADDLRRRASNR